MRDGRLSEWLEVLLLRLKRDERLLSGRVLLLRLKRVEKLPEWLEELPLMTGEEVKSRNGE